HVGADVEKQQQPAEQEERDDEQRRHEADEDVGERQLTAHSPQQAALGADEQTPGQDAGTGKEAEPADGVDQAEDSGGRNTRQAERQRDALDEDAENERAASKRAEEPGANGGHAVVAKDRIRVP